MKKPNFYEQEPYESDLDDLEVKRYMSKRKALKVYRLAGIEAEKNPGVFIHIPRKVSYTMLAIAKEKMDKEMKKASREAAREMRRFGHHKKATIQYDIAENL